MAPPATGLFERFTRDVFSVIQVEILVILLQGCSHQQGRPADSEANVVYRSLAGLRNSESHTKLPENSCLSR